MFDSKLAIILCRSFALFNFLPQCPNCVLGNANLLYTNMLSYYIYILIYLQHANVFCVRNIEYCQTHTLQPVSTVLSHSTITAGLHCVLSHQIYSQFALFTFTPHLQLVYAVHSYNTIAAGLQCTFSDHNYSRFALYNVTPHLRPVYAVHFYTTITASILCTLIHLSYSWFILFLPHRIYIQFTPHYSHTTITAGLHCTMSHHI